MALAAAAAPWPRPESCSPVAPCHSDLMSGLVHCVPLTCSQCQRCYTCMRETGPCLLCLIYWSESWCMLRTDRAGRQHGGEGGHEGVVLSHKWLAHDKEPTIRPCWDTLTAQRPSRGEAVTAPLCRWCLFMAMIWVLRAYQLWPHNGEVSTRHATSQPLSASCAVRASAWMCEYSIKPCPVVSRCLDIEVSTLSM